MTAAAAAEPHSRIPLGPMRSTSTPTGIVSSRAGTTSPVNRRLTRAADPVSSSTVQYSAVSNANSPISMTVIASSSRRYAGTRRAANAGIGKRGSGDGRGVARPVDSGLSTIYNRERRIRGGPPPHPPREDREDMAANPILEKWRAGEPTLGGWMVTDDPQVAEFLAQAGFDEICVDQQHGLADQSTIGALFRAIELHGVAPTTRVPSNDFAVIGKALDLGALAVIIPMVNNAEEAAYAAAACHYPPRGKRSVGPVRGLQARSSRRLEGLDEVACVVMIETADGIRNADAIAATPGVDCIYIGPGDLAIGLGLSAWGEDWSPEEAGLHAESIRR